MMKKLLIMLLAVSLVTLSACSPSDRGETTPGTAIAQDPHPDTIQSHQTEPETTLDEPGSQNLGKNTIPTSDRHGDADNHDDPEVSQAPNAWDSADFKPSVEKPQETTGAQQAPEQTPSQSAGESTIPAQPSEQVPTQPTPNPPEYSEPAVEEAPEPETTQEPVPEEPTANEPVPEETEEPKPAFNVDDWVGFAVSYGQQIGLTYDSSVTECWDNPIIASPNSIYLERDITSRLNRYLKRGMTAFGVWAQPRGDGAYDIYIAYA